MLFKLAWRNIWRNKRRTAITLSSIFFAVLLALFTRSMQEGSYSRMIETSVEMYSGYLQIHREGYWKNKSINKLMEASPEVIEKVEAIPEITYTVPRLETFALAAANDNTKGVQVIGTAPNNEHRLTKLKDRLVEGSYFEEDKDGVMIAQGLAKYLDLVVNDTLILLGQGYHGTNAVGKFPISGVLKLPNPEMNKSMVYMPIKTSQIYNGAPGMVSALVIVTPSYEQVAMAKAALKAQFDDYYEVMNWQELQPELIQLIESDRAGGIIMLGILYMIIAFGIFGTIMMMTVERTREFGILISVGMQKIYMLTLVAVETLYLGLIGLGISLLAGIPLLYYMYLNPILLSGDIAVTMENFGVEPIIPFSLESSIFISQGLAILVIVAICLIYPLQAIMRLQPVQAVRGG